MERELQWDDQIVKDGPDFILLPEGDYPFTITKFERGRHQGSTNLPACPKAMLEVTVHSDKGDVKIKHNLFLHSKAEGFLSRFFTSIGQKKEGEPLRMNWQTVIGSKGYLRLKIDTYQKTDGSQGQSNKVDSFYMPSELVGKNIQVPSPQQTYQQPPAQQYQQPPMQQQYQQQPGQYQQPPMQQQPPQTPFPTAQGGYTNGQF